MTHQTHEQKPNNAERRAKKHRAGKDTACEQTQINSAGAEGEE
jgi:hypothetical protein